MTAHHRRLAERAGLRHEALLYSSVDEFVSITAPLLRSAVDDEKTVLVATTCDKIEALLETLGSQAEPVQFEDVTEVGSNPARLTALWRRFAHRPRTTRQEAVGIAEFVWPGRTRAEITEAQTHEMLLDEALADASLWLVCPYNVDALDAEVVEAATRSHPLIRAGRRPFANTSRPRHPDPAQLLRQPLEDPPDDATNLVFNDVAAVRDVIRRYAAAAGLDPGRTDDVVTAVNELATNTIEHTPGPGTMTLWRADDLLCCQVADRGHITDPLVGSHPPHDITEGGRGLWMVNQLCDLVQLRSSPHGTVVRVRVHCPDPRLPSQPAPMSRTDPPGSSPKP